MNKAAEKEPSVIDWSEYSIPELQVFLNAIEYEISRQREAKRKELKERIQGNRSDPRVEMGAGQRS